MSGIHWTDRDQLLSEVARQEDTMNAVMTPSTQTLADLDHAEVSILIEALETMLKVHMGTDRFTSVALIVCPMLEQLGVGR